MRSPAVLQTPQATDRPAKRFRRVVVAIGADGGAAAIHLARQLAAPDAAFVLVRVHHPRSRIDHTAAENAAVRDRAAAIHLLHHARAALGTACEIVAEDAPYLVDGLHRVAEREAADLLVLGPHRGVVGAQSALPGALRGATCAVAIAGQQPLSDPLVIERVGIARCATPFDDQAARAAAAIADRHRAELHTEVVDPGAPPALDAFAKTVDLLAIGSCAHGALRRRASARIAEELATRCPCALLVVTDSDEIGGPAPEA